MNNYTGIIIGGLIPAVLFGTSGLFLKTSNRYGVSLNYYLLFAGIGVILVSLIAFFVCKEQFVNRKSAFFSFLVGAFWGAGAIIMAVGVAKYNLPISVLAPIVATNSLVTVFLGFLVYSEWRDVNAVKLLIGTGFIIVGSVFVAHSN